MFLSGAHGALRSQSAHFLRSHVPNTRTSKPSLHSRRFSIIHKKIKPSPNANANFEWREVVRKDERASLTITKIPHYRGEEEEDVPKKLVPKNEFLVPTTIIRGLNFPQEIQLKYHQEHAERNSKVALLCPAKFGANSAFVKRAESLASQLGLTMVRTKEEAAVSYEFVLIAEERIMLQALEKPPLNHKLGPVYSDFVEGSLSYRRRNIETERKSPQYRALLLNSKNVKKSFSEIHILDATGGLGDDAFVMASLGYQVTVLERDPIIYTLLYDGYKIGMQYPEVEPILSRIKLIHADSMDYLKQISQNRQQQEQQQQQQQQQEQQPQQQQHQQQLPDIIYLDPMYPHKEKDKTALPKKKRLLARQFLAPPTSAMEFVEFAQNFARESVVLKRPVNEPISPSAEKHFSSKMVRYEVFPGQSKLSQPKQ